jgi:hypothetical protein
MEFYEKIILEDPDIDEIENEYDLCDRQSRDGNRRFYSKEKDEKILYSLFKNKSYLIKRKNFPISEDGKTIIDCDLFRKAQKKLVKSANRNTCKKCNSQVIFHSPFRGCLFEEQKDEYEITGYYVRLPKWLENVPIQYINKKPDDNINFYIVTADTVIC